MNGHKTKYIGTGRILRVQSNFTDWYPALANQNLLNSLCQIYDLLLKPFKAVFMRCQPVFPKPSSERTCFYDIVYLASGKYIFKVMGTCVRAGVEIKGYR